MASGSSALSSAPEVTLAVTCGDPAGIGPEVAAKALAGLSPGENNNLRFLLVGASGVFGAQGLKPTERRSFRTAGSFDLRTDEIGVMSTRSGAAAVAALQCGIDLVRAGEADGLVTAPLCKEATHAAGYPWAGQTEVLVARCGVATGLMLFVADGLRVALATRHVSLKDVSGAIDIPHIVRCLELTSRSLKCDFAVPAPRIAVAGLNPHAGEGGLFGEEERKIIIPAIAEARNRGLAVEGPFPADTLFARLQELAPDGVLAMYHDQGLIPVKLLSFGSAVNVTAGLPVVRTSPDHGTAYDIAGKGVANPSSMLAAIRVAVGIVRNRRSYLHPGAPLV